MSSLTVLLQFTVFLALLSAFVQAEEVNNSKRLDEGPSDQLENKCGGCPCDNPCNPVPSPPPPSPPPPPKQPQPTNYCPPPPAPPSGGSSSGGGGSQNPPNPPYIYVNGPPGNVYPIHPYYSSDGGRRSFSMGLIMTFFISTTILWLLYISF